MISRFKKSKKITEVDFNCRWFIFEFSLCLGAGAGLQLGGAAGGLQLGAGGGLLGASTAATGAATGLGMSPPTVFVSCDSVGELLV